jgi:hypothetical protein
MANSTARTASAIASGQKLILGVLFTGLYCRTLKPVPGRPALTYRCPHELLVLFRAVIAVPKEEIDCLVLLS